MSRVMVTGALGFLGRHVVEALSDEGHFVLAVDVRSHPNLGRSVPRERSQVRFVQADLTSYERVQEVVTGNALDVVVHTAWQWGSHEPATLKSNLDMGLALAGTCQDVGVGRFIFIGTAAVYGQTSGPLVEGAPFVLDEPARIYPAAKALLTTAFSALAVNHPGRFVTLIPGGPIYGVGMRSGYENRWPLFDMSLACAGGTEWRQSAGGDQLTEYIHVRDVVRGVQLALTPPTLKDVYHISVGRKVSTSQIAALLNEVCPSADIAVGPGRAPKGLAPNDHFRGPLSFRRARRDLGYAPQIPLRSGLLELTAWLRNPASGTRRYGS